MTAPHPMPDADLLAWAVVLDCRIRQQRAGIRILLMPFPPCPTCRSSVHTADTVNIRRGFATETRLTVQPCGHIHTVTDDDIHRIRRHIDAMLDHVDAGGHGWGVGDIIREARTRVGRAAEPADGAGLTADEARSLADDLSIQLYRAQDALDFVGECCNIADREHRQITTGDVREWLKGAQCGRQLASSNPGLYSEITTMFGGAAAGHNDGPTVDEAAVDDRTWDLRKAGE